MTVLSIDVTTSDPTYGWEAIKYPTMPDYVYQAIKEFEVAEAEYQRLDKLMDEAQDRFYRTGKEEDEEKFYEAMERFKYFFPTYQQAENNLDHAKAFWYRTRNGIPISISKTMRIDVLTEALQEQEFEPTPEMEAEAQAIWDKEEMEKERLENEDPRESIYYPF